VNVAAERAVPGVPALLSAGVHVALIAGLFLVRPEPPPPLPPVYRVNLVAAPAAPRQVGVVQPQPATPAPAPPAPAPTRPVTETPADVAPAPPRPRPAAERQPQRSTPTPATETPTRTAPRTPVPTAGGGPTGGSGSDVANVRTEGIEFPYPGYLENIVRQIALRFSAPSTSNLRAEVVFLLHRDGSVTGFRFLRSSGSYAFDIAARGAVESAAESRAFGPLPRGFNDDVLPVIFSFSPQLIR
jgi:periplasmic protein TonB